MEDAVQATEPLAVHYFSDAEEAAEAVTAAGILDLGVRLTNTRSEETDEDETVLVTEWKLELFSTVPGRED